MVNLFNSEREVTLRTQGFLVFDARVGEEGVDEEGDESVGVAPE